MRLVLPRLYVILDAALLTTPERECARQLVDAGVRLLQYRNKGASSRQLLENAKRLSGELIPRGVTFIVNDRCDVAALAEAGGVQDRKSTRLNSSHGYISYAVFCLKKKKKTEIVRAL